MSDDKAASDSLRDGKYYFEIMRTVALPYMTPEWEKQSADTQDRWERFARRIGSTDG